MRLQQTNIPERWRARRHVSIVCFLLVGLALVLQAVHYHPDEFSADSKPCVFCQVSHAPVQVTPVAVVSCDFTFKEPVDPPVDRRPNPVVSLFSLFCRPPPAV